MERNQQDNQRQKHVSSYRVLDRTLALCKRLNAIERTLTRTRCQVTNNFKCISTTPISTLLICTYFVHERAFKKGVYCNSIYDEPMTFLSVVENK